MLYNVNGFLGLLWSFGSHSSARKGQSKLYSGFELGRAIILARLTPNMTPEQAKFLLDYSCPTLVRESKITQKVITAMPAGQEAYKPSDKCMTASELAYHLASADVWFLNSIASGSFVAGGDTGDKPSTPEQIVAWYETNFAPALDKVKAMTPDQLAANISFFGMMDAPAVSYLNFMLLHSAHHRGQLSSYLRPMGGKVPAIYGGSADEPMK